MRKIYRLAFLSVIALLLPMACNADESDADPALRVIREQIYILRMQRSDREREWCSAIRTLVMIGRPAVPELVRELERPNSRATMRSLGYTLRAIGDPRAVPALIREVPGTLNRPGSDMGLWIGDQRLTEFLQQYEWDQPVLKGGEKRPPSEHFSWGRPVSEVLAAIESITGHEIRTGDEITRLGSRRIGDDPLENERHRLAYQQRSDEWLSWWELNKAALLTEPELPPSSTADLEHDPVQEAGEARFGRLFPTGEGNSLGPVHEFTLRHVEQNDHDSSIDFDRHRLLQFREGWKPTAPLDREFQTQRWVASEGVDAFSAGNEFLTQDLHLWRTPTAHWDMIDTEVRDQAKIDPGDSFNRYELRDLLDALPEECDWSQSVTMLFTTREGGQGILQVLPVDASGDLRLRYRLWNDIVGDFPPRHLVDDGIEWLPERTLTLQPPGPGMKSIGSMQTGLAREVPDEIQAAGKNHPFAVDWARKNGIDLRAEVRPVTLFDRQDPPDFDVDPPKVLFLLVHGRSLNRVHISSHGYDTLTPAQVGELVDRWHNADNWRLLDGAYNRNIEFHLGVPCIHAFRTETGRCGMLQYVPIEGQLDRIEVRYRLAATVE